MKGITPWFVIPVLLIAALLFLVSASDSVAPVQRVTAPMIESDLAFASVPLPLDRLGVRERMDRELLVGTFRHSSTILTIKRASRWFPVIEPILAAAGIPDDFKYLAVIESGLSHAISPVGAKGFWQFMPKSAREFGLEVHSEVDQRYHVELATRAACMYLEQAHERYGDWLLAAASYNMGMTGVSDALKAQRGEEYWDLNLNRETGRYVYRLYAMKQIMSDPEAHGFFLEPADFWTTAYGTHDTIVKASISNLADFAAETEQSYNSLKLLNPWLISDHLPVASGDEYTVILPN